ncbi:MAG: hypothetical protein WC404_01530 [Candidatus Omnitrophota bacterium]|jgi:amino acid permease
MGGWNGERWTWKEVAWAIFQLSLLVVVFLIGYNYRGPMPAGDNNTVDLKGIAILAFLWICYKLYSMNKRIKNLEMKQKNENK